MNENLRICEFDEYYCSKLGAIYIANNIGVELTDNQLNEIAHRRKDLNKEYGSLSDEQVFATSLSPEQMVKFKDFFKQIPDLPAEFIRPFKPSEPAEITEIIKPSEIIENLAS